MAESNSTTVSTIESIFGSLNITTEDKGKFLTVDNNFNPYWQNINETSVGDSWAYTQFSTTTIVQLPALSTSIGGIVAVLRNDKQKDTPAYIILKPQEGEQIMGQTGVWANNVADENYASIVLKAISYTDNNAKTLYTWVIANGVNSWNNFASDRDTGISNINAVPTYNIRVQKIGSNTLSGGIGMSGVEFVSFRQQTDTNKTTFSYLTKVTSSNKLSYVDYNTNYQIPNSTKISRTGTSISTKLNIFDNAYTSITTYAFNVATPNNFSLKKPITKITTLYAYIALNNTNNSKAFALYKVSGKKFTVSGTNQVNIDDYSYIPLFSIELTNNTNANSIGRLIEIPIDDDDIDGFTIAFESEDEVYTDNTLNFDFIGVDQEKSISISPEVEFDNCGINSIVNDFNTLNWGTIGNVNNCTGSLQIFKDNTAYKPGNSITKTIFKFSQNITSGDYTKYGTLLIDWLNTKYYYNATTGNNASIVASDSFYNTGSDPIVIKSGTMAHTKFIINNFSETISSLPIKVQKGKTVSIVIENYKTQYSIEKEKYDTPVGSVIAFAGNVIPENWFLCNGEEKTYDEFPTLGKLFGATKSGDKFNLPDLRNKFIMGYNDSKDAGPVRPVRSTVDAGLPNINGELFLTQEHESIIPSYSAQRYTGAFECLETTPNGVGGYNGSFDRVDFSASRSNSIYGRSNTVQPPSVVLCYIIKVK